MEIKSFEDLGVWQRSFKLAVDIFEVTKLDKNYVIKDHLVKTALSVPSNIAEGFERTSNKEYIRFLDISKGSSGELRTQLMFAKAVNIIENSKAEEMITECREVGKMLGGLIKSRRQIQKKLDSKDT
ncbi:four helix bundle protein [Mongoliitalea daihaiensis]|uniref:four helix bundle protein n=1 Tax=Mongoliitalea daihaiensis TaxID=2782006 RepID=UPI001F17A8EA|nr:four helix bundle protein [Mongoliitalea daihaiensis]UJP63375.1 four helix bundle protein [Mongoliitalea daihaiensis]